MRITTTLLFSVILTLASYADGPNSRRDTKSDTWVATDALGRTIATNDEVGPLRKDKFIGMFYFLWLGQHSNSGPWNVTEILNEHPDAMKDAEHPAWGPEGHYHHFAEPLFGYYLSTDPWVYRKHAQMLSDAGVDTIIFDTSNGFTYPDAYMVLLDAFAEVRANGGSTPQIAFLCPFGDSTLTRRTVTKLWDELYSPGIHRDLWFQWEGKPLIMAWPEHVTAEQREFFTFRSPYPGYFNGPDRANWWSWLQVFPQHVFFNDRGEAEQMAVGVAQNARYNEDCGDRLAAMSEENTRGRSWHNNSPSINGNSYRHGYNFSEQWGRALQVDPQFIFVTGWNEWVAMRLKEFNNYSEPVMFVDSFDIERSRDIEPMKGGYGDDYYFQFVDYVRRFKGARPQEPGSPSNEIKIDGDFADWESVQPEFFDDRGDTWHRNHDGWGESGPYINTTGRNDISLCKMTFDEDWLYAFVETSNTLSERAENNWMVLYINADKDSATGWLGYDYAINRRDVGEGKVSVEQHGKQGSWTTVGSAQLSVNENKMELSLPIRLLEGMEKPDLYFKWSDNMQTDDPLDFIVNGDTAPNGRFAYRFFSE